VFTRAVLRHHGTERAWTERLATDVGVCALLHALPVAPLPEELLTTAAEILDELEVHLSRDEHGTPDPLPTHHAMHQLHLDGRFPDVAIWDAREQLFAVVEAQRGTADDRHITKLATHYVPRSGARLGVLVAERWRRESAGHPAWAHCPEPVVVLLAHDTLHEVHYEVAWVHRPDTTW
jgi:hypothetical protein